jgi:hypothetical protein
VLVWELIRRADQATQGGASQQLSFACGKRVCPIYCDAVARALFRFPLHIITASVQTHRVHIIQPVAKLCAT